MQHLRTGRRVYGKDALTVAIASMQLLALILGGCAGQAGQAETKAGTASLPSDIFPPPVPAQHDGFSLAAACPNPAGLERVSHADVSDLIDSVSDHLMAIARGDKDAARKTADQSFWPILDSMLANQNHAADEAEGLDKSRVAEFGPASEAPHTELIRNHCGEDTLEASWWIQTLPREADGATASMSLRGNFYLIRRNGHWLVWGAE
ncbi:hypothetical protein [Thermaerobacter litoralis]